MKTSQLLTAGLALAAALTLPGAALAAISPNSSGPLGLKLGISSGSGLQNAASGSLLPLDWAGAANSSYGQSYAQTNWNNLGRSGDLPQNNFKGNDGKNSYVSVAWDAPSINSIMGGGTPTAQTNADNKLMNSYLNSNGTNNDVANDGTVTTGVSLYSTNNEPWVYVTNISLWLTTQSASSYDVVLYSEGATDQRICHFWIEKATGPSAGMTVGPNLTPPIYIVQQLGGSFIGNGSNNLGTQSYVQVPTSANTWGTAQSGNYAVFPGMTADSILIRSEEDQPVISNAIRAPFNAVQLIPHKTMTAPVFNYSLPASPVTNFVGGTQRFLYPASGPGISYVWKAGVIGSGTYTNLSDTGGYSGTGTAQLTITNVANRNQLDYVVVATSSGGSVTSQPMTMYVVATLITSPPKDETLYPGGTARFSVGAAAPGAISYQWYKGASQLHDGPSGNLIISGSTTSNLTLANIGTSDGATYSVTATSGAGPASASAVLTVLTLTRGSFAESVMTNGAYAYWRLGESSSSLPAYDYAGGFNGTYLSGVTVGYPGPQNPPLAGFESGNSGIYTYPNVADNWVSIPALNLNTNTVTFVAWVNLNGNQNPGVGILMTRHNNTTAGFNFTGGIDGGDVRANELGYSWDGTTTTNYHSGIFVTNSIWSMIALVITPTNVTFYCADTSASLRSAVMAIANTNEVWAGPATIGSDDSGNINNTFYGTLDEVAVFKRSLSTADLTRLWLAGANNSVAQPPVFSQQPVPQQVYAGRTAVFSAPAVSMPTVSYRWQAVVSGVAHNLSDGVQSSGSTLLGSTTSTLTVSNVHGGDALSYQCVATGPGGAATSSQAALTLATTAAAYETAINSSAPVGYWRLNETSLPYAYDFFGGHTATYAPNASQNQAGPQNPLFPGFESANVGVVMSPNSDQVWVNLPPLNLNTNTVTITAWINPAGVQTNGVGIVMQREGTTTAGLNFYNTNNLGYIWNDLAGSYNWNSGLTPPANQWSFVALVVGPAQATLYCFNAITQQVAVNVLTHPIQAFAGVTDIGTDPYRAGGVRNFNGYIDEVAVWNRALTGNQIGNLYTTASGTVIPLMFVRQPASTNLYAGPTIQLSADVLGQPISYRWLKNGAPVSDGGDLYGTTNLTLTISNTVVADSGNYQLVANGSSGSITSSVATVNVRDPACRISWSNTNAITLDVLTNQPGVVVGAAVFGSPVYNIVTVTNSVGAVVTYNFTTNGTVATVTGSGTSTPTFFGNELQWGFTGNTNFDAVLCAASFDGGPKTITIFGLAQGHRYAVYLFGLDDYAQYGGRTGQFQDPFEVTNVSTLFVMSNNVYTVGTFVAATNTQLITELLPVSNSGNLNALIVRDLSTQPSITLQPVSGQIFQGYSYTFLVNGATPSLPSSYQWQKGSGGVFTNLGGSFALTSVGSATMNLALSSLSLTNSGDYRLVLTNSVGAVTSQVATLTVLAPAAGTFANALLSYGPLAYWQFNETNGTVAYEYAGGLNGSYGAASVIGQPGTPTPPYAGFSSNNLAFICGPANSMVTVPGLGFTASNLTILAWVYMTNNPTDDNGFFMVRNSITAGVQVRASGQLGYHWNGDNQNCWGWNSGAVIPTNQWAFIAVTISPTVGSAYVVTTNRVQVGNNTIGHDTETWASPTQVGHDPTYAGRYFPGLIDEVAVFTRTLSLTDITNLYNATAMVVTPAISQQPLSAQVYQGRSCTFFSTGTSPSLPAVYQWQKGSGGVFTNLGSSVAFTNAANNPMNLALSSVSANDAADYRVVLTNSFGAVTSQVATLTILPLPAAGTYAAAVLSYGPVAHWQFDETSGLVAYENINGWNGNYTTNDVLGQSGPHASGWAPANLNDRCFETGVSNSSGVAARNINIPATSNLTIIAWVYPTNVPLPTAAIAYDRNGTAYAGGFQFNSSDTAPQALGYSWNNNNSACYSWIPTNQFGVLLQVPTNMWSLVALTISPSGAMVYCYDSTGNFQYASNPIPHDAEAWTQPLYMGHQPNPYNSTPWDFGGLMNDVSIYARTLSMNNVSNLANATVLGPPPAPTGLSATPGYQQITISWPANPETDSYNVKYATNSGGPYTLVGTNVTDLSFVHTNLMTGTNYYYVISAANLAGVSANSAEVSARPQAPPVASFTFSPGSGVGSVTVNFVNHSTGIVSNSFWDFGDGLGSTNAGMNSVTYTYTLPQGACGAATNYASLTVTNYGGSGSVTSAIPVVVFPPAPTPDFNINGGPLNQVVNVGTNQVVSFADTTPSGCPYTRVWYFGDGGTGVSSAPNHAYTNGGTKIITLAITNAYGLGAIVQGSVVVTNGTLASVQGNPGITKVQVVNGTNVMIIGTNTPLASARSYNVLGTNNLSAARGAWPVVGGGTFAANGGFTNLITGGASGPRQYYIIQVP